MSCIELAKPANEILIESDAPGYMRCQCVRRQRMDRESIGKPWGGSPAPEDAGSGITYHTASIQAVWFYNIR